MVSLDVTYPMVIELDLYAHYQDHDFQNHQ